MQYNSVFALILRIALLCVLQVSHGGAALQVQLSTAVLDFDTGSANASGTGDRGDASSLTSRRATIELAHAGVLNV